MKIVAYFRAQFENDRLRILAYISAWLIIDNLIWTKKIARFDGKKLCGNTLKSPAH